MPVAQGDVTAAVLGDLRIVCYEDDGTSFGMELLEKYQYLERGACVQISRRFVGEDDCRVVHQGTGDGDALHLSAGHLVTLVHQAVAQPYGHQCLYGFLVAGGGTERGIVHQGEFHVFNGCRFGQQVVTLKYESDLAVTQRGTGVFPHGAD